MEKLFSSVNLNIDEERLKSFEEYFKLLVYYNEKFNITAITEKEEVFKKHFVDSAVFASVLPKGSLLDVGAGGGFPSLPIKIMRPELKVTCLEATGKKCEFLNTVAKNLNLDNVSVVNGRAEEAAHDKAYRERFDCVCSRAVARLNILAEYCMPFVKVGGTFAAYKGADAIEELKEAEKAIKALGGRVKNIYEKDLFGAKRHLIEIEKIKSTDSTYPRANGKIRKKPL